MKNLIEKYGMDKLLHFLGGAWITSLFSPLGWFGIIVGVVLAIAVSVFKEICLDKSFDKNDIVSAAFGCGASVVLYVLIKYVLVLIM